MSSATPRAGSPQARPGGLYGASPRYAAVPRAPDEVGWAVIDYREGEYVRVEFRGLREEAVELARRLNAEEEGTISPSELLN